MPTRSKKDKLTLYQRHLGKCDLPMSALDKCECVYWVRGWLRGKPVRQSLDTRSLSMADLKRKAMLNPAPEPPSGGGLRLVGKLIPDADKIELAWAEAKFHEDKKDKISLRTMKGYRKDIEAFRTFSEAHSVTLLHRVTTEHIEAFFREYGNAWNLRTKGQKLTCLRIFFKHAVTKKWLVESPAADKSLNFEKPKRAARKPFSADEIRRIVDAIDQLPDPLDRLRARALILLMLYTGMRVSDAVFCEREWINRRHEVDYVIIKTGKQISLPPRLHPLALKALKALPPSRVYYFLKDRDDNYLEARHSLRSGEGEFAAALPAGVYSRSLSAAHRLVYRVMMLAGLRQTARKEAALYRERRVRIGHAGLCHRFRDTFAVNLLVNGADIYTVSQFLGHSDVKITSDHYLKLVDGYQERMSAKTDLLNYPLSA
jgi:site-specific recombinase XerD